MPNVKRETIITALMTLANSYDWNAISLPMIAKEAHVSLPEMSENFPSKGSMLAGFTKMIDQKVLKSVGVDMGDETPHDQLLDIMLKRFDAFKPYKLALGKIRDHYKTDILGLLALNGVALNSWRYMLAAANIDTEGHLGAARIQGAALVFASCFETWLNDESEGNEKTMACLDRYLKKGEMAMQRLTDAEQFISSLSNSMKKMFGGYGMRNKYSKPNMEADI